MSDLGENKKVVNPYLPTGPGSQIGRHMTAATPAAAPAAGAAASSATAAGEAQASLPSSYKDLKDQYRSELLLADESEADILTDSHRRKFYVKAFKNKVKEQQKNTNRQSPLPKDMIPVFPDDAGNEEVQRILNEMFKDKDPTQVIQFLGQKVFTKEKYEFVIDVLRHAVPWAAEGRDGMEPKELRKHLRTRGKWKSLVDKICNKSQGVYTMRDIDDKTILFLKKPKDHYPQRVITGKLFPFPPLNL